MRLKFLVVVFLCFPIVAAFSSEIADPLQDIIAGEPDPYLGPKDPNADVLRIDADIDGDGQNEMLLSREGCVNGKQGNVWDGYARKGGSYSRIGSVTFHPAAYFIGDLKGIGRCIVAYGHCNADTGVLVITRVVDGKLVDDPNAHDLQPGIKEEDGKLYGDLFGGNYSPEIKRIAVAEIKRNLVTNPGKPVSQSSSAPPPANNQSPEQKSVPVPESVAQCMKEADNDLNAVYWQLLGKLNESQKERLKKAQHAWIKYRDLCAHSAEMACEESDMRSAAYANKMTELTAEQTTRLRAMAATMNEKGAEGTTSPTEQKAALKKADDELNVVYKAVMKNYSESAVRKAVTGAEVAWLTFRDLCVDAESSIQEKSAVPIASAKCMTELTESRIKHLKGLFGENCPEKNKQAAP